MADYTEDIKKTPSRGGVEELGVDNGRLSPSELRSDLPVERQTLDRYISLAAVVLFDTLMLDSWEIVAISFQFSLFNGGPASMVYGCILAMLGGTAVAVSLAEMASMDPTVGAQYRWTANFAPSAKRFWGLLQGWITVSAWIVAVANCASAIANIITQLVIFHVEDYTPERWHTTLIMWLAALFPFVFNLWFRKILNVFEVIGGFLHIAFFIISMVVLIVMGKRSDDGYVWETLTYGVSGWDNKAVCWGIGLLTVSFPLSGVDGVLHMSDEVKKVRTRVPQAMIIAVTSNAIMMFAYVLVLLYRIGNLKKVGSQVLPLIEVYYEATQSKGFTTFLVLMPAYIVFCALFNAFASVSRLVWQFAKDNGLPFSRSLSYVHPTLRLPLNSLGLVGVCTVLLALIYTASDTAYLAITALAGIAFNVSYIPPIGFLLYRRLRGDPPQFGKFRLGKWGVPINVFSLCYLIFIIIWMPFPSALPVTKINMNYAGPVFGGIIICALLDWFISGRKRFQMPVKP